MRRIYTFLLTTAFLSGLIALFTGSIPFAEAALLGAPDTDIKSTESESLKEKRAEYARRFRRFQNRQERRQLQIRTFSIVDANTRKPIDGLHKIRFKDGATINLADLPTNSINLRANVRRPFVRSVRFFQNGQAVNVSNRRPYFLMENGARNRPPAIWAPTPGTYVIRGIAFSERRRRGIRGPRRQMVINVVDEWQPDPNALPLAGVEQWEENMTAFGALHCDQDIIEELTTFEGSVWNYDGIWVYHQIADWTNDPSWYECADFVKNVYRNYVLESNGVVPGWRVFSDGLRADYLRTGQPQSLEAIQMLANNSPFAHLGGGASHELSRETAHLLNALLVAELVGQPLTDRVNEAANYALGHLEQWTVSESAEYVHPYRIGVTMEALIRYYERTKDHRVPAAIQNAAVWLWNNMYHAPSKSFYYVHCQPGSTYEPCDQQSLTSPDLNMLVAPAYAWLWHITHNPWNRDRADILFQGSLEENFLQSGKHFSQNYRWAFDFIRWRLGALRLME